MGYHCTGNLVEILSICMYILFTVYNCASSFNNYINKISIFSRFDLYCCCYLQVILIAPNKKHVTDEAFNLYKKYQLLVHNDDPNRLTPSSLERFCYKSPVKVIQLISHLYFTVKTGTC